MKLQHNIQFRTGTLFTGLQFTIASSRDFKRALRNISDDKLTIRPETFIRNHEVRYDGENPRRYRYTRPSQRHLNIKIIDMMKQQVYAAQDRMRRLSPLLAKYKEDISFRMAYIYNRFGKYLNVKLSFFKTKIINYSTVCIPVYLCMYIYVYIYIFQVRPAHHRHAPHLHSSAALEDKVEASTTPHHLVHVHGPQVHGRPLHSGARHRPAHYQHEPIRNYVIYTLKMNKTLLILFVNRL